MRVIGYVRVSTNEQGESGAGLAAQRKTIEAWASYRGATITRVEQDVASGKSTDGRTGLDSAIAACEAGDADAIVVAKLDRLSRSLKDFATIVERSRKRGWSVVVLDLDIDLTTATGEMVAGVLAVLSQWERRIISERTRAALAIRKSQGKKLGGTRRPMCDPLIRRRILGERRRGLTYRAIADRLNEDGVPTTHNGRKWHPMTVRAIATKTTGGRS